MKFKAGIIILWPILNSLPAAEFGRDFFVYGGARYEAFTARKTYGEALTACSARGGNLVEIFDDDLNAIVVAGMQQLVGSASQVEEYLIGVTPNVNGWFSGATLDYTKWCTSSAPSAGSSVVLNFTSGKFCWDGIGTTDTAGYICQITGENRVRVAWLEGDISEISGNISCNA